jgi:phosphatidylserine/phosphatidylglycerophosphate/cardiolipin synthase-like enzyme
LIIPESDRGTNFNAKAVQALLAASAPLEAKGLPGIHIKEMPGPETVDKPYTHAKWLVADDNNEGYLGSENYTNNSLHHSREIGLILNDAPTMQKMVNDFNHDWARADAPPFNNADALAAH